MYKAFSRFICGIMLIALVVSVSFGASAADYDSSVLGPDDSIVGCFITEDDTSKDNRSRAVIFPDIIDPPGDPYHDIFSITATRVQVQLLSKDTNKWFNRNSLPTYAKSILCKANLNHSLYGDDEMIGRLDEAISCGVCSYNNSEMAGGYVFKSVCGMSIPYRYIGQNYEETFLITDCLEYNTQYYAYIENNYVAGYVFGTLELYWLET